MEIEKLFEVTFKNGEKKNMTEDQLRTSRIFSDVFADMLFNLQRNESVFHHETGIEYKRIK